MPSDREERWAAELRAMDEKRTASREKKRARKERFKPWQALRDDWARFVHAKWGTGIKVEWAVKEQQLARKLLKEVDLKTASKAAELFIDDQRKVPGFAYFWTARAQYVAIAEGKATRGDKGKLRGETRQDLVERKGSIIGW